MKPARLRSKLRKIRTMGEDAAEEGGELNVVPYLDIVVNVIMFMMATTTFAAAVADINVSSPTNAPASVAIDPPPDEPKNELNLTVSVSERGFTIAASGAVLYQGFSFDGSGNLVQTTTTLPTIPKQGEEYDYAGLAQKMLEIKRSPAAAGETKIIVNANPTIVYDVVVQVLDACRGKLVEKTSPTDPSKKIEEFEGFADVLLSAGVN
jgi:biopolymer transport protein ExbD